MRRRAAAALVLAGLATACGSEPLSEEAYRAELERLCATAGREASTAEEAGERSRRFQEGVRDLEPPERLEAAHADLLRRFEEVADLARVAREDPDRARRLAEDLDVRADRTFRRLGVPGCVSAT